VDVDGGGRWKSEEDIPIFLLFFQDFSGLGSMSNMLALGLIKWGEEFGQAPGTSRPHLIMSDDEYGGGGGGGDYDYGGPRCVRLHYLVNVYAADLCSSFTEDTFVRKSSVFCTRIDPLRQKRTTDTTSWPKTPRTANKPVQMASRNPVRSTQPMATLVVTRR
jgi:hypothetical protein